MNKTDKSFENDSWEWPSAIDIDDLENVEKAHGISVAQFLRSRLENVEKTMTGALILSSRKCFDECLRRATTKESSEFKANSRNASTKCSIVQKRKRKASLTGDGNVREAKKICKSKTNNEVFEDEWKQIINSVDGHADLRISTKIENYLTRKRRPSAAAFIFPHVFQGASAHRRNGKQLFYIMMGIVIGRVETVLNYEECLNDIDNILTELQRKHEKYKYCMMLKRILKGNSRKISKYQFEVTLKQYQDFFFLVIAGVIPKALFGCHKNFMILRKALKAFYLLPYGTELDLCQYIGKLDILRIPWLQKINNRSAQWLVIAKVTKWLFDSFFMPLFNTLFEALKSLYSYKRIIVHSKLWTKLKREYLFTEISTERIAIPDDFEYNIKLADSPFARMELQPKPLGVRPIYRLRKSTEMQKQLLDDTKTLLVQLYRQKYDFLNNVKRNEKLHATWLSYATAVKENINRKLNVVTCDVTDAYGSIDHKKLFDIVMSLIDQVRDDYLEMQNYEVLLPKSTNGRETTQFHRWYSCLPATFSAPNFSLIAISKRECDKSVRVETRRIVQKIRAYIFQQWIIYGGQKYVLAKGIMQGSPLSPILSDIYYQEMMIQEFGIFMQSGSLLRYVDDFIYMTESEESAKRFLDVIKEGIPEYNCRFKASKIQTNVESKNSQGSKWVGYIGYELNGHTMEVRPKYEKQEFQYLRAVNKNTGTNSLWILNIQLKNIGCLKLNRIILDPKINTLDGILESVQLAANLFAARCAIYVSTIFSDPSGYRFRILAAIKNVVKLVESRFYQYLTASDHARFPTFRHKVKITIWISLRQAFARYAKLRAHFIPYMKAMILREKYFLLQNKPPTVLVDSMRIKIKSFH